MVLSYKIKKWDTIKDLFSTDTLCNDVINEKIIDIISMAPLPIINDANPNQLVVIFTLNNKVKIIHDLIYFKKWLENAHSIKEPTTNITLSPNVLSDIRHALRQSKNVLYQLSVKYPSLFGIKKGNEIKKKPLNDIGMEENEYYVLLYVKKQPSFSNGFVAYSINDNIQFAESIQREKELLFAQEFNGVYQSFDFLYRNVKISINHNCITFIIETDNIDESVYENLSYLIKYVVDTIIIKSTVEVNINDAILLVDKIYSWTRKKLIFDISDLLLKT